MENTVTESAKLMKLLDDSEKRYIYVQRCLEGAKIRNRQLSTYLNKEKDEKQRVKTALNVAREKVDENRISLNNSQEKVSHLESEVEKLEHERMELTCSLEAEKERRELLENELDIFQNTEPFYEDSDATTFPDTVPSEISRSELQGFARKLKSKLDSKELECNELEDKLLAMEQSFVCQGSQQRETGNEYEQEINVLKENLARERNLNNFLSDECDHRVMELVTQLQQLEEHNNELEESYRQASERITSVEQRCRFYKEKAKGRERSECVKEKEQKVDVSCQFPDHVTPSNDNTILYDVFVDFWNWSDSISTNLGNNTRCKVNIIKLIQSGFKRLSGSLS